MESPNEITKLALLLGDKLKLEKKKTAGQQKASGVFDQFSSFGLETNHPSYQSIEIRQNQCRPLGIIGQAFPTALFFGLSDKSIRIIRGDNTEMVGRGVNWVDPIQTDALVSISTFLHSRSGCMFCSSPNALLKKEMH